MSGVQAFSVEYKQAMVKKLLQRGTQTIKEFCKENNLAVSTVSRWKLECARQSIMTNKKETHKYSPEEILKIISETYSLTEEELGLYLRKQGLHSHQLAEWKNNILNFMNQPTSSPVKTTVKKDDRDKKIKELEKNLKKKNAALAEVSALLILEKKMQNFWGKKNDDEES